MTRRASPTPKVKPQPEWIRWKAEYDRMRDEAQQHRDLVAAARGIQAERFRRDQADYTANRDVMAEMVAPHRELAELVLDGRVPFHEAHRLVVESLPGAGPSPEAISHLVAQMDRLRTADDIAVGRAEELDLLSHPAKFALAREMGVLQAYCG